MNRALETVPADPHVAPGDQVAPPCQPDLLNRVDVCARLGVSRWTWRRWERCGQAPARVPNVPGHPRWRRDRIEDFARGLYGAGGRRVFFGAARRGRHTQQDRRSA